MPSTLLWKKRVRLTVSQIFERAQLDWRRLRVNQADGSLFQHEYPLSSKFFLSCAREDLKEGGTRGLVNALSNAKRAIDCKTDSYLCAIGFSPHKLASQLGTGAKGLTPFTTTLDQPLKFRVLESLGIVTPGIVARVRRVRNLLEHEYKKPAPGAVRDAIDIAALYVSSLEGSMNSFIENITLGRGDIAHPLGSGMVPESQVAFGVEERQIQVRYWNFASLEEATFIVSNTDDAYLDFLRVLFAARAREKFEEALANALTNSGYTLAASKIGIQKWELG